MSSSPTPVPQDQQEAGREFHQRLQAARARGKMAEADLASAAGLPVSAIIQFEAGSRKPSFDNLRRLATHLNVTTDYLLGRVDNPDEVAAADPLFRHIEKMADSDREVAGAFMKLLIASSHKRKSLGT